MQRSSHQLQTIERVPMLGPQPPRVLVVEDETMVSMLIEEMVYDLGGQVIGPAAKFEQAMKLALDADFDLAVLDVNLDGLVVYPIADVLRYRGVPFIFTTGYDASVIPQRYRGQTVLSKPFSHEAFCEVVAGVMVFR
jgi:CheY-like chemotaxis protein